MIFDLSNPKAAQEATDFFNSENLRGSHLEIKVVKQQRTLRQNSALHLMLTQLADELNDAGLYMQRVLKQGVEIQWTPELAKEYLWRPIQKVVTSRESTAELNTKEIDQVFEYLQKHLGEKLGLEVEFPNIQHLIDRSER